MTDNERNALFSQASDVRANSYSPYSGYSVGAALLCSDGSVYTGCNIENAAYTPTVCAERTAFFKAVSSGERDFCAIAVAGGKDGVEFCTPCGVCRQVMAEFSIPEIILARPDDSYETFTLQQLLPLNFDESSMA